MYLNVNTNFSRNSCRTSYSRVWNALAGVAEKKGMVSPDSQGIHGKRPVIKGLHASGCVPRIFSLALPCGQLSAGEAHATKAGFKAIFPSAVPGVAAMLCGGCSPCSWAAWKAVLQAGVSQMGLESTMSPDGFGAAIPWCCVGLKGRNCSTLAAGQRGAAAGTAGVPSLSALLARLPCSGIAWQPHH